MAAAKASCLLALSTGWNLWLKCRTFNLKHQLKVAEWKYCEWGVWRGDRRCRVGEPIHAAAKRSWEDGGKVRPHSSSPTRARGLSPTQGSAKESKREGKGSPYSIGE